MGRDRAAAIARRAGSRLGRATRLASAQAYGISQRLTHVDRVDVPTTDDATLSRRVESMIFRNPDVPKGRININAQHGVVVLRGEVDRPEQIRDLEDATRDVPGVREVENLLHLRGTPAPNKEAAVQASHTVNQA